MDAILQILGQLGVDFSYFYQFGIFMVLFILMKTVFFNKLQFVLELRESRTSKLDESATDTFAKADDMAAQYQEKLEEINKEAQVFINERKDAALNEEKVRVSNAESEIESEVEKKRSIFTSEIQKKREEVLGNADSLSKELVGKLV